VSARLHRVYRAKDARHEVDVRLDAERLRGAVDGRPVEAEVRAGADGEVVVRRGGRDARAVVARRGGALLVSLDGRTVELRVVDPAAERAAPSADPFATSPMAGLLVKVPATPGAAVAKGGVLFVVEAMKMEYQVAADRDLVVGEVRRKAGERVDLGEVVVTFRDVG
jgi:acetyl/propionyl-CoA carboxylase alpha subunit